MKLDQFSSEVPGGLAVTLRVWPFLQFVETAILTGDSKIETGGLVGRKFSRQPSSASAAKVPAGCAAAGPGWSRRARTPGGHGCKRMPRSRCCAAIPLAPLRALGDASAWACMAGRELAGGRARTRTRTRACARGRGPARLAGHALQGQLHMLASSPSSPLQLRTRSRLIGAACSAAGVVSWQGRATQCQMLGPARGVRGVRSALAAPGGCSDCGPRVGLCRRSRRALAVAARAGGRSKPRLRWRCPASRAAAGSATLVMRPMLPPAQGRLRLLVHAPHHLGSS